jgi:hypothetical protein
MRRWTLWGALWVLAAGGCAAGEHGDHAAEPEEPRPAAVAAAPEMPAPVVVDTAEARARIEAEAEAIRATFEQARTLGASEVAGLRRDVNAQQIAAARSLGVRVSGDAEIVRLVRQGRLVELEDSTAYWILRRMEHSSPYLTPDAHAMLEQLGRRFHERLDSLGLPRYRMRITSVLRTDQTQAQLRRVNPNASTIVSAHEFGTTLDVSHERFAVPADAWPESAGGAAAAPEIERMRVRVLEEIGREHSRVLQAELGRAIIGMRDGGALLVMMEDRQPVYHMTVARRFHVAN